MKKYISPEIETIILHTAEDCLTLSNQTTPDAHEEIDFGAFFE